MDPDLALVQMRQAHSALAPQFDTDVVLLNHLIDGSIHPEALGELIGHVGALLDAFGALDNWLSQGGFLPKEWKP